MEKTFISVIIPTLNRKQEVCDLLYYFLEKESYSHFEVFVIEQSDVANLEVLKLEDLFLSRGVKLNYIHKKFRNQYAAANYAVWQAKGEIVLFIDDDVEPQKNFLQGHILPYSNPAIAAVTGPILNPGQPLVGKEGLGEERYKKVILNRKLVTNINFAYYPEWAPGCNLSFRKDFFRSIEGYDENFYGGVPTGADSEIWLRVKKAGGLLYYCPQAAAVHKNTPRGGCRDITNKNEYFFRVAYNRNYLFYKWGISHYRRYRAMWQVFRKEILNKAAIAKGPFYLIIATFYFFRGLIKSNKRLAKEGR